MITAGMATIRPKSSIRPRSALQVGDGDERPGCGGTNPCSTESPARAGMPTPAPAAGCGGPPAARSGRAGRRRPRRTAGCRSARPPRPSPTAGASGHLVDDGVHHPVGATGVRPADRRSSRPARSAARRCRRSSRRPVVKLVMVSRAPIPATTPSTSEPRISERNGCTFSQVISTTTTAMPSSAASDQLGCCGVDGGGEHGHGDASWVRRGRARAWRRARRAVRRPPVRRSGAARSAAPGSSSCRGSSVASWLSSSDAGM